MAKKKELSAADIAVKLADARQAISEWKRIEKPLADELKKLIKKGEKQNLFEISVSSSFKVENKDLVLKWANKYAQDTITVDTKAAREKFCKMWQQVQWAQSRQMVSHSMK